MGSPTTSPYLILSDLKRLKSRSLRFRSLISRKGAELGHMLLLSNNRKESIIYRESIGETHSFLKLKIKIKINLNT